MKGGVNKISVQCTERRRHAYDSYIKKALRRELYVCLREKKKRLSNEVTISDLPDIMIAEWAYSDRYSYEYSPFYVDGHSIFIKNDRLADALEQLPIRERDILLMHYFLNMSDFEIAVRLQIPRRTVNYRRHTSCRLLRRLMGGDQYGKL